MVLNSINSASMYKISLLSEVQYKQKYAESISVIEHARENDLLELKMEFQLLGTRLNIILEKLAKLKENSSWGFGVSDEFQDNYYTSGVIYSNLLLCPSYVFSVMHILKQMKHHQQWYYHSISEVELYDDELPLLYEGEFIIHLNELYAPGYDGNDYKKLFTYNSKHLLEFQKLLDQEDYRPLDVHKQK